MALRIIGWIQRVIFASCRYRVEGYHHLQAACEKGIPVAYGLWHGHQFPLLPVLRDQNVGVIVSRSRDGDRVSYVMNRLGYLTYRGSSSRGAVAGLIGMIKHVRAGHPAAFTVDGPRGPAYESKPGIFSLVRKTNVPLIPMAVVCDSAWRLKSWDHYLIPRPFSSLRVLFGPPLEISMDDGENSLRLKESLFKLAPDG